MCNYIQMNYSLAMAVGQDAANSQMRKAGRAQWNLEDRKLAADTFWKIWGNDVLAQQGVL